MKSSAPSNRARRSSPKSEEKEPLGKRQNSQNPSRRHRVKLNTVLEELTSLLPLQDNVKKKLDKLSVLKLTVSFFQTQNLVRGKRKPDAIEGPSCDGIELKKAKKDVNISELALEAIGGFFLVLTEDANVFYISENVHSYLGYTQAHMMHQNFLSYLHEDDIDTFRECLCRPLPETIMVKSENYKTCQGGVRQSGFCNIKCHAGRLSSHVSPFYYKCFKFDGNVRLLTMEGMNGQRQYGLFAVCMPVNHTVSLLKSVKQSIKGYTCQMDSAYSNLNICNRGMKYLHLSEKDLSGNSAYVFFHPEDLEIMSLAHEKVSAMGKALSAFRVQTGKGKLQWVRGKAIAVIGSSGEFEGLRAECIFISDEEGQYYKELYLRDISDWKRRSLTSSETSKDDDYKNGLSLKSDIKELKIDINDKGDLAVMARKTPRGRNNVKYADILEMSATETTSTSPILATSTSPIRATSTSPILATSTSPNLATSTSPNLATSITATQHRKDAISTGRQQCAVNGRWDLSVETKPPIALNSDLPWTPMASGSSQNAFCRNPPLANRPMDNHHMAPLLCSQTSGSSLSSERMNIAGHSSQGSFSSDVEMSQPDELRRQDSSSTLTSESDSVFEEWNGMPTGGREPTPGGTQQPAGQQTNHHAGHDGSLPDFAILEQMLMEMKKYAPLNEHNQALSQPYPQTMNHINTTNTRTPHVGTGNMDQVYQMRGGSSMTTGNPSYAGHNPGTSDELEGLRLDDLKSLMSLADIFAPKDDARGNGFGPSVAPSLQNNNEGAFDGQFPMATASTHNVSRNQIEDFQVKAPTAHAHAHAHNELPLYNMAGLRPCGVHPLQYTNLENYNASAADPLWASAIGQTANMHPFPWVNQPQFDFERILESNPTQPR